MRQLSDTKIAPVPVAPEREYSPEEAAFRNNPVLFVELARDWAAGGEAPTTEHEELLRALPRRRIRQPEMAREALWDVLSQPQRGRALAWLDKMGLLEEMIPIWFGDKDLRALRLRAVEEVHLERWAKGLSKSAMDRLNKFMEPRVDGRLNGWGLTSLATLVLESNGYTKCYSERLNEELRELGALDNERMRVMTAVIEYPFLHVAFKRDGEFTESKFSPATVVAALATRFANESMKEEQRKHAVQIADRILAR